MERRSWILRSDQWGLANPGKAAFFVAVLMAVTTVGWNAVIGRPTSSLPGDLLISAVLWPVVFYGGLRLRRSLFGG